MPQQQKVCKVGGVEGTWEKWDTRFCPRCGTPYYPKKKVKYGQ